MSESATPPVGRGPWLLHPVVDLLIGCGLLALPLGALLLWGADGATSAVVVAFGALSIAVLAASPKVESIALIDIDQGALEAAVPVLKAAIPTGSPIESRLLTIVADATKEPDVEACAKKVVQRFERLDAALLNCCHRGESKSIFDVTEDDFDRIMTNNAKSGMSLPCLFDNVTLR